MDAVKRPQSLEEVKGLELALDTYMSGLDQALISLEAVQGFEKVAKTSQGDISFEAFSIVQKYIDSTQHHLQIPQDKQVVLEYYNNRPLKDLALEGLAEIKETLVKIIKATFDFIVDCLKAIFFLDSKEKETQREEDVANAKAGVTDTLNRIRKDIGDGASKYQSESTKVFGLKRGVLDQQTILATLDTTIKSLSYLKGVPGKLETYLKKTVELSGKVKGGGSSNLVTEFKTLAVEISSLLKDLPESKTGKDAFKDDQDTDAKIVEWVLVSGFDSIAIKQSSGTEPLVVNFKPVKDKSVASSKEVDIGIFNGIDTITSKLDTLNSNIADFVAEVEDSNRSTKSLGDRLTSILEKLDFSGGLDSQQEKQIFSLIKGISACVLKYISLFAAMYKKADYLRVSTINILTYKWPMSKALGFKKEQLNLNFNERVYGISANPQQIFDVEYELLNRPECETMYDYLHLIPYIVLVDKDTSNIFVYSRGKGGGEARLHGNCSIGLGGHMEDELSSTYSIKDAIVDTIGRELEEEVGLPITKERAKIYREKLETSNFNILLDNTNDVGKVHIGLTMFVVVDRNELGQVEQGVIERGTWMSVSQMAHDASIGELQLENWSRIVLAAILDQQEQSIKHN